MAYPGTRSAGEAVMPVATEGEYAAWRRAEGNRIVRRRGRWWEELKPGFYQCVHWMARFRRDESERPVGLCWGFRTTLSDTDASAANGHLPAHVLSGLHEYDMAALPPKRRNKLRKSLKHNEILQVLEPQVLHEAGYEVRCSVAERLRIWRPPPKERYLADLDAYVSNPHRLVLAGMNGGKLRGYLDAFAVDETAYIHHVYLHSDAFGTEIGTGLVFELIQACRRAGTIREIVYGLDTPSIPSLSEYKTKMGFPVVKIPARHWMAPPTGRIIRWWQPEIYYRLTGVPVNNRGRGGVPGPGEAKDGFAHAGE